MIEIWKSIPGFPGYEVSNKGRLRSYKRPGSHDRAWKIMNTPQRILKTQKHQQGYQVTRLSLNGKLISVRVARLVMLAFVGPCPEGMEVCHNNNVNDDDRLTNLRYDTHTKNLRDSAIEGEYGKLTEEQVIEIRTRRMTGETYDSLASDFSRTPTAIQLLCFGKTYRYFGGPRCPAGMRGTITQNPTPATNGKRLVDPSPEYVTETEPTP